MSHEHLFFCNTKLNSLQLQLPDQCTVFLLCSSVCLFVFSTLNLRKRGTGTAVMWRRWWWAAWSARAPRCRWASANITKLSAARSRLQSFQPESSALTVSDDHRCFKQTALVADNCKMNMPGVQSCIYSCSQRPLTWSWTPLWSSRRFTSRIDLCTCSTALPRRIACPNLQPRPTGPMDTAACSASPPRSTTSAGPTSSRRPGGTRGSGTPVTGNAVFISVGFGGETCFDEMFNPYIC